MSKIQLKCTHCGKEFLRENGEHNRNLRKGITTTFCSLACNYHRKKVKPSCPKDKAYNISKHSSNRKDKYSPFRVHIKNAKLHERQRKIERDFDLTLEYLYKLWELQHGICPYTRWKMQLLESTYDKTKISPNRASLDRIDNSKGYIKGNVQFISYMAQCAKNQFDSQELISFCKAVASNHK